MPADPTQPFETRPLRSQVLPTPPTADGTYLLLLTVDSTPAAGDPVHKLSYVDSTDYENA